MYVFTYSRPFRHIRDIRCCTHATCVECMMGEFPSWWLQVCLAVRGCILRYYVLTVYGSI